MLPGTVISAPLGASQASPFTTMCSIRNAMPDLFNALFLLHNVAELLIHLVSPTCPCHSVHSGHEMACFPAGRAASVKDQSFTISSLR